MKFPRLKKRGGTAGGGDGSMLTKSTEGGGGSKLFKSRIYLAAKGKHRGNNTSSQSTMPQTNTTAKQFIPTNLPKMEDLLAGAPTVAAAGSVVPVVPEKSDENGGISTANTPSVTSTNASNQGTNQVSNKGLPQPPQLQTTQQKPQLSQMSTPKSPEVFNFNNTHRLAPRPLSPRSPSSAYGHPLSPRSPQSTTSNSAHPVDRTVLSIHSHQVELRDGHPEEPTTPQPNSPATATSTLSPVMETPSAADGLETISEQLNQRALAAAIAGGLMETETPRYPPPAAVPFSKAEQKVAKDNSGGAPVIKEDVLNPPVAAAAATQAKTRPTTTTTTNGMTKIAPIPGRAASTSSSSSDDDNEEDEDEGTTPPNASSAPPLLEDVVAITPNTSSASSSENSHSVTTSPNANGSASNGHQGGEDFHFDRVRSGNTMNTMMSMRSEVLIEDSEDVETMASNMDETTVTMEREEDEDDDENDDESRADEGTARPVRTVNGKSRGGGAKKKRRNKVNEKRLRDGHRRACRYLKNGDYEKALTEFETILELLMSTLGESHRRVGSALHNVGIVNIRANHLDDAIDAIEEAVRIRKEALGSDHPKVADSLVELGIALLSQKDFEDALEIFNEALEVRELDLAEEARHGTDQDRIHCVLQVAKVLNNIGCVYFEYGSLDKARKTFEDVMEMQKEAIEEVHERDLNYKQAKLSLASTLCNLGYVHMENSEWDEAIDFLDEAYSIQSTNLPQRSSLTLNTLDNLAYANFKEKNHEIAIEMYNEVLLDQAELYGKDDIACAQTLVNIACVYIKTCDYQQALKHLSKAEDIQLDALGGKSRRLKTTREMIGCIQYEMLKFPSVAELFNRAMTTGGMKNPINQDLICSCGNGEVSDLEAMKKFQPTRPESSSKMSGHKISYA